MTNLIGKNLQLLLLSLFACFFLVACGGSGGSGDGDLGTLKTSLTDASTDEYQAIYVTIARVDVHMGDEGTAEAVAWETVAEPDTTYNLLELVNGVRETLGIASLEPGHYTQMRLIIGSTPDGSLNIFSQQHPFANYLIDQNGDPQELKVPSGLQTGLKIVNGFDISAGQTTDLILDFDAMRSVVKAGASGKYLLKPTVKVLNSVENAIVTGMTMNSATLEPVAGAMVTAQIDDATALDPQDQVAIAAGTVSEDNGQYALFLKPDSYHLVATAASYHAACLTRELTTGEIASLTDLILVADGSQAATVTGLVDLSAAPAEDQFATVEFRQEINCVDETSTEASVVVTVKSVNIADLGTYSVDLPAGNYQIIATSFGMPTRTFDVTLSAGGTTVQDISFSVP